MINTRPLTPPSSSSSSFAFFFFFCCFFFISPVLATRLGAPHAQRTPSIPGGASVSSYSAPPAPTSPPRAVRQLVPREDAVCGYMMADGAANMCGANQYCTTSANGNQGLWNCCNASDCFMQSTCADGKEWYVALPRNLRT